MMAFDKLYKANEAARMLGVSKRTLLKWCHESRISFIRYPEGAYKFRESVLEIFLGRNTIPATNTPPDLSRLFIVKKKKAA
jgi:excisionase family DNA binding protein